MDARTLRGKVAESGERLYEIAPRIPMHPTTLGKVLRGRVPLSEELAQRILSALGRGSIGQAQPAQARGRRGR